MEEWNELDALDRQLREAAPYIDDAGFSGRVLQQLPVRRRNLQRFRAAILLGATLVASMIAYFLSDGGRFISNGVFRMAELSPLLILLIAGVVGALVMGVGVAAAVSKSHEFPS